MSQSATEPAAPSGIVVAVRKFRDLIAFLLLGYVALDYLLGLGHLLIARKSSFGSSSSFTQRAANVDSTFLSLFVLGVIVVAVLLVLALGERSKLARPVVITALALEAVGVLFGFITMVAALFTKGDFTTTRDKVESTLSLLLVLGIFVLVGLVVLGILTSPELRPAPKPQPAYQQYQGAPQGYGGYQQQGQQAYGYQPQGQYDSPPPYQPQGQYEQQQPPGLPAYEQHAYEQPTQQGGPAYEQQQPPPPQQPQQQPAYEPPPPIWEPAPPPPPAQQPQGWPPPPPPQQPQQRWPEGDSSADPPR